MLTRSVFTRPSGLVRCARGLGVVAALSGSFVVGGSGVAQAYGWPSLPVSLTNLPASLVGAGSAVGGMVESAGAELGVVAAAEGLTGAAAAALTAAESAAVVGGATVAAGSGAIAAGAILGTGAALVGYWKLGGLVGQALPCLDCAAPSGATGHAFAGGWATSGETITNVAYPGAAFAQVHLTVPAGVGGTVVFYGYYVDAAGNPTGYNEHSVNTYTNSGTAPATIVAQATACLSSCGYGQDTDLFGGARVVMVDGGGNALFQYAWGKVPAAAASASYAPTGSSGGSTGASSGAALQVTTTSQCSAPAGGAVSSVLGKSAVFHSADSTFPPAPYSACPAGTFRTGATATVAPVDGSGAAVKLWGTTGVVGSPGTGTGIGPDGQPLPAPGIVPLIGTVSLTLTRVLSDGTERAYDPNVDRDLANDPVEGPRNFRCHMGAQALALSECKGIFSQLPISVVDSTSNCDGSGFSFNPVSWVVVPLKCLFIPRTAVVNAVSSGVSASWAGTPPALIVGSVGKVVGPIASLSSPPAVSCQGPVFTFHFFGPDASLAPFDACSGLTAQLSAIVLPLSAVFVYVGGFWLAYRLLGSTIGLRAPGDA